MYPRKPREQPPEDDEYDPDNDGPEAKAYRAMSEEEKRRHDADVRIIMRLLDSLKPADARRHIFTWAEQKEFKLRRKRDG